MVTFDHPLGDVRGPASHALRPGSATLDPHFKVRDCKGLAPCRDRRAEPFASARAISTAGSRLNAGSTTHIVDDAAIAYMRARNLSGAVIGLLSAHATKTFADQTSWTAHLQVLGIAALDVGPDPVRISTEGALWGALAARGVLDGTVIVSDGAGQFDVGWHALCWVHANVWCTSSTPSPRIGAWSTRRSGIASGHSTPT